MALQATYQNAVCNEKPDVCEQRHANQADHSREFSMINTVKTGTGLAAAAALFALASMASAATPPEGSTGRALSASDTVHCYGTNSCKGTADCKTANHECKGQNGCKGQGFKASTAGKCLKDGGTIGDLG